MRRSRLCGPKLDLIKGKKIPWMRIEKPQLIRLGVRLPPLKVAVETATINLIDWLVTDYGYTPTDAYCLLCRHCKSPTSRPVAESDVRNPETQCYVASARNTASLVFVEVNSESN